MCFGIFPSWHLILEDHNNKRKFFYDLHPPSSQHCHVKEFLMGLLRFGSQSKTYFASTKKPPRLSHSAWAPAQLSTWRRKMNSKMFWRNRCAFCVFCNVLLATSKPTGCLKKTFFSENWAWQILLLIMRNPPSFFLTNAGDSFCNSHNYHLVGLHIRVW